MVKLQAAKGELMLTDEIYKEWRFEDALKDTDVEEIIDWRLHRPLAFLLIKPLQHKLLFITPTHITIISMIFGIGAGVSCFLAGKFGSYWFGIGALCMLISVVLDCADGMLARFRGQGSGFGQMLDIFADHVSGLSFWFGMTYSITYDWQEWWAWPLSVLLLMSIMVHVTLYDQYKEHFIKNTSAHSQDTDQHPVEKANYFEHVMTRYYENAYQGMFSLVEDGKSVTKLSQAEFREAYKKPMRLTSFLGLGSHLFLMCVIAVIAVWSSDIAFQAALIIVIGILNLLTIIAIANWRSVGKQIKQAS